jgi:hypothetical protein
MMDIFSEIEYFRNTKNTLINLMKLIRLEKGLNLNTKISIPIVFVLNKFDLYNNGKLEERHLLWNGNNDDEILNKINEFQDTILKHFEDSSIDGLGNLLEICRKNFSNHKFIPVSSLGYNPIDNNLSSDIKPFDIEYPYVYLLNNL